MGIAGFFESLKKLCDKYRVLLVIDEIQDIAPIKEAQGLLRASLQSLSNAPVIIMGSEYRVIHQMTENKNSPLYDYGEPLIFKEIPVEEWLPYFNDRLEHCSITPEGMSYLVDTLYNIPNSLCEVGHWINEERLSGEIGKIDIHNFLKDQLSKRAQMYRYSLSKINKGELTVIKVVAELGWVKETRGKDFVSRTGLSASGAVKIIERLIQEKDLQWDISRGVRVSNPLLAFFLLNYPA